MIGRFLRYGFVALVLALGLLSPGCSISTQGGPIFAPQVLSDAGGDTEFSCIRRYSVAIAGGSPWLEQQVRQEWLQQLAERSQHCDSSDVRVELTGVSLDRSTDAFGSPGDGDPESTPPPARMRVATKAIATIIKCRDGADERHTISSSGWLPYSSDPFAVEERVVALARELVRRDARRLDMLLMDVSCDDAYARPLSDRE